MCIYIFKMHTFILRIYICGIQLQEQRYHISGIAVPIYWNGGAILAGFFIKHVNEYNHEFWYARELQDVLDIHNGDIFME